MISMTMSTARVNMNSEFNSFGNTTFQVGFDAKTGGLQTNGFPNQLISLSHIRNYAHQPPTADLLHTLKEKAGV